MPQMPPNPLPMPTPASSPDPSEQDLLNMPMEQLQKMVFDRAADLTSASKGKPAGGPSGGPAAPPPVGPPPPAPAPGKPPPPAAAGAPVPAVDTELVKEATGKLAAAGLLTESVDTLTPELISSLQKIADDLRPGLYDLSSEDSLHDFLQSIANGTLDLGADGGSGEPAPVEPRAEPGIPGAGA